jgi:LytS/YehU family sensor histidine kinase
MILPLIACETDIVAAASVPRTGGIALTCVFVAIFVTVLIIALVGIIKYILTLKKSKELELQISRLEAEKKAIEAELSESRTSMMLSKIQPHFIYNTLGTIEQLCLKDPQMAFELTRNFALYLRCNLSELDSVTPIRFSEEIKHVQYYVNIENVRFPDMTIEYQLDNLDFVLPAISVQPLVENAIKHGLMPLESGGRVVIRSYQTDTHFCVEVSDNGVGFDTHRTIDKKEHVGLYNVRERLKAIVNGDLKVESAEGVGTKATILIPKEERRESHSCR